MPSFQMDQPPVVAARGDAEALRQYIVLLVDRLKYVLNHLDDENIQSVSATKIGRRMGTMADALGEKGTDNERVRQMVRELTMTTLQSAMIGWSDLNGFDEAVTGAMQEITEALEENIGETGARIRTYRLENNRLRDDTGETLGAVDLTAQEAAIREAAEAAEAAAASVRTYTLTENTLVDDQGQTRGSVDLGSITTQIGSLSDALAALTARVDALDGGVEPDPEPSQGSQSLMSARKTFKKT